MSFPASLTRLLDALNSTTQELILPNVVDNFFEDNPTFFLLKDQSIQYDGGTHIEQPLNYGKNPDVKSITGISDDLVTSLAQQTYNYSATAADNTEIISNAKFDWKHYVAPLVVDTIPLLKNSGGSRIVDKLQHEVGNTMTSVSDLLGDHLWGVGSPGANDIDGILDIMNQTDGTAYGNINNTDATAAGWTWKAQQRSGLSGSNPTAPTAFDIRRLLGLTANGQDQANLLLSTQLMYDGVWALMQDQQRFRQEDVGFGGFPAVGIDGRPLMVDPKIPVTSVGDGESHPLYALNTRYISLFVHMNDNFRFEPFVKIENKTGVVAYVFVTLNVSCSNRQRQGQMINFDPGKISV